MSRMGVMPIATGKKNDPPPPPQDQSTTPQAASIQEPFFKKSFHSGLEEHDLLLIFICEFVVENVYVNLNETSPM